MFEAPFADILADGYGSGEPIQDGCASADGALVQAFGWLGCLAAWGLFLAPMPTMRKIMKAGHIGDFSPLPYLISMLQCFLWAVYALPFITPCKTQPLITNIVGFLLELAYILVFVRFAHSRRRGIVSKSALVCLIAAVIVAAAVRGAPHIEFKSFPDVNASRSTTVLGFACSVLNVAMYGSPLGVVRTVIRTRSVRYMPLPLTIGCGLCSIIWTVYALLVMDFFIMVSEQAGSVITRRLCDAAAPLAVPSASLDVLSTRAPYRAQPSTCSLHECRPERLPLCTLCSNLFPRHLTYAPLHLPIASRPQVPNALGCLLTVAQLSVYRWASPFCGEADDYNPTDHNSMYSGSLLRKPFAQDSLVSPTLDLPPQENRLPDRSTKPLTDF